ncbi:MAG: FtsW/RodA/SpoVE family cell cycle protein [Anaerolineales bacterium]|nr:FtsW/RodA/SpoVE family cell cycle protein [Anaerolineales bacterium]
MNRILHGKLLRVAFAFLCLQATIITLAPAVRARSLAVDLRWSHWVGVLMWSVLVFLVHRALTKRLPDADPYLFPAAALLSGWGLLTIWELDSNLGARQTIWLDLSLVVFLIGLRLPGALGFLQRYKYILLTGGFALVALTLLFGTNPMGFGPRLWLGCCGVYFQPSEALKLLLIVFLSAHLSDRLAIRVRTQPLVLLTAAISGLGILLLVFQRDLGTAAIFIALFTVMIYLATGKRRTLLFSVALIAVMSIGGYFLINIVHARVDSWLNPWADPKGGSYQIIQALFAVANGGLEGRGPGLGSPAFVPVAESDFIFAAIAEDTGLFGTLGLLALFGLIIARGLRAALRAPDLFRRFCAAGIASYFGIQTILIIGGNLRLLPLTGVTLPFVSYGGSSLLTSFVALLFLVLISDHLDEEPAPLINPRPYLVIGALLALGIFAAALANGWWAIVRGPDLLSRADNPRRIIEDQYVPRGDLVDRNNSVITTTVGEIGSLERSYVYPDLAPVTGYNDPKFGQSGLEASLDEYLRGLQGVPATTVWWNHLLYGMSPPGLDVRLTIDLYLQFRADEMMLGHAGAAVMMNAQTGEILVMASHPTFNPNHLAEIGEKLKDDLEHPLIDRAAQGLYPTGTLLDPFAIAVLNKKNLSAREQELVHEAVGFDRKLDIQLETSESLSAAELDHFHVSPLKVALASAALSAHGIVPAPSIASAVNTPAEGWVVLPVLGAPFEAIQPKKADEAALSFVVEGQNYWSHLGRAAEDGVPVTWFIAGTLPNWQGTPIVVVVLLEEDNTRLAQRIGQELIVDAMNP